MKDKIKNKSSVVRIIISNYDTCSIKELKIIHEKKAFLDCLEIVKMEVSEGDKRILFREVKPTMNEEYSKQTLTTSYLEDGSFKISSSDDTNKREYLVSGEYLRKEESNRYKNSKHKSDNDSLEGITVKVTLEMLNHPAKINERYTNRRRDTTTTERKLLSEKQQDIYSKISLEEAHMIDSKKIYQINRFLEYRSDFLMYFSFVNNLFIQYAVNKDNENGNPNDESKKKHEIWKIVKESESEKNRDFDSMAEGLNKLLIQSIKDKNSKIDDYNKDLLKGKKKIELYKNLTENELRSDVEKIIKLFSGMRHALVHFDYKTFNNLFLSEEVIVNKENDKLSSLLDLNLFRILESVKDFKEVSKSLYIEKDDKIFILGSTKKMMTLHRIYWLLCERKNGFNKFINSLFFNDGAEDKIFKEAINKDFFNRIDTLEAALKDKKVNGKDLKQETVTNMKTELETKQKQRDVVQEAYIDNIHYCKAYKEEYVKHQILCAKVNDVISKTKNKQDITRLNKEIAESKRKMEVITTRNSLIRLEYKLRVVFNLLAKEFGLDIKKFKDEFDPSKTENFDENKLEYINYELPANLKFKLGDIEKKLEENNMYAKLFSESEKEKNNLFKFSLLTYLLLPKEMRGSYTGSLKKYYYDIKNFTPDENPHFFHSLRLFEKNTKKFEIFNYDLSSDSKISSELETLKLDMGLDSISNSDINLRINKAFVPIIFGYYRNVFSYLNNLELNMLLSEAISKNKSILEIEKKCYKHGAYNFNELCQKNLNNRESLHNSIIIRNNISHLNYGNLLSLKRANGFCGLQSVHCILDVETPDISRTRNNFNNNPWNDLEMRRSQLRRKLLKDSSTELLNDSQDLISSEELALMSSYKIVKMDEIMTYVDEKRLGLKAFETNADKTEITDFFEIEIVLNSGNKKTRKAKLKDLEMLGYKKEIIAAIKKELEKLENIYVKSQIKLVKQKFLKATKLD